MKFRNLLNKKIILGVFLTGTIALGTIALGTITFGTINNSAIAKTVKNKYEMLEIFVEIMTNIEENYVEEIDSDKLIKSAIKGMISDLDPHSTFLDEKDFDRLNESTTGEFAGVGMTVQQDKKTKYMLVVSPIDATPAFKAGMKSGDLVIEIDDVPTDTITFSEGIDMLRGKPNTDVNLKIWREDASKQLDITITRAIIKVPSVKADVKNKNIGYIRITSFQDNTQAQLEKAFKKINKMTKGKVRGYILDLRNNPGGLLSKAISVSDSFLNQGEIVSTRGRDKTKAQRWNAKKGDMAKGLPVVILINRGSASASEIVAGALQDHKRALLVGETSFGKGSVQSIQQISKKMAIKFTTARYYTPSGRSIQGLGITPDVVIKSLVISEEVKDAKYTEASLKGSIKNNQIKNSKKKKSKAKKERKKDKNGKPIMEKSLNFGDYILARGLNAMDALIAAKDMK